MNPTIPKYSGIRTSPSFVPFLLISKPQRLAFKANGLTYSINFIVQK